jgi:hypothetical protein
LIFDAARLPDYCSGQPVVDAAGDDLAHALSRLHFGGNLLIAAAANSRMQS